MSEAASMVLIEGFVVDKQLRNALIVLFLLAMQGNIWTAPVPSIRAINARSSQLHRLGREKISKVERRPWHPAELVAILGDQKGRHWESLMGLSHSPNGKWIASLSWDRVCLWETPNLCFGALLPINATFIQFVPEQHRLLTCGSDGIVRLWDVDGDKPRSRVLMRDAPIVLNEVLSKFSHVAASPDGKKLAVATGNGFDYYDMNTSPPKRCYLSLGQGMTLLEAGFSPNSHRLVTLKAEVMDFRGYLRGPWFKNQELTLWDVSVAIPKRLCAMTGPIWWWGRISFSPDGKTVVCGANIWDLSGDTPKFRGAMKGDKEDAQELHFKGRKLKDDERPIEGENIQECLFLPSSRYALTTGYNYNRSRAYVRVRDMRKREPQILQTVSADHAHGSYQTMALSPDGKHLAVGEGNCLHLWDMKDERIQTHPPSSGHTQDVKGMSFGACGNLLATISRDTTLRLWDLDGQRPHERLVHKQKFGFFWDSIAVSPDGTKLAAGFHNGRFTLWEISLSGLRVLAEHQKGGDVLSFSPDSKMLFSVSGFGGVNIIDVSKPMESTESLTPGRAGGHFRTEALAVSPDGQTLAVGGACGLELWQRTDSAWRKRTDLGFGGDVKSLCFGGRGGTLLVGGGSYKKPVVHLYDVTGEAPKPIAAFKGLRDVALSVTASSTGKLFAACDATGRVVVWSTSGKKLHEWTFPGPVHCVAFAPDGRHLALGNGDGTVYILRLTVPTNK